MRRSESLVVSDYLLGLKLVGGYNVCNRHNLLFINRKEILWHVLKGKGTKEHRLTHTEEEMEPEHICQGAPWSRWGPETGRCMASTG